MAMSIPALTTAANGALSQAALNGYIATLGAAAGVGAFILLFNPKAKRAAIISAVIVLVIGFGIVAMLESDFQGTNPTTTQAGGA